MNGFVRVDGFHVATMAETFAKVMTEGKYVIRSLMSVIVRIVSLHKSDASFYETSLHNVWVLTPIL